MRLWKDKPDIPATSTGYEYDYPGATAKEYTEYVYNEYRWKGRNYKGQHAPEIVELVRAWLKETYPGYKFSVRRENYHSIHIRLMKADFEAFTKESGKVQDDINHHHIHSDKSLTDRAKEVMLNVCDFIMSYNFDDSDAMTDYFHTNFYLTLAIGSYRKPYKVEPPKLDARGRQAGSVQASRRSGTQGNAPGIGHSAFRLHRKQEVCRGNDSRREDHYGSQGEVYFWPKEYSSAKMAQKRIDKLEEAGIRCELTGYNGGYIRLLGYTPEMRNSLERERQEYAAAYQAWYSKQNLKTI